MTDEENGIMTSANSMTSQILRVRKEVVTSQVSFREDGVSLLDLLKDTNLTPPEKLVFIALSAAFPEGQFENLNETLDRVFPGKPFGTANLVGRKCKALRANGYIRMSRTSKHNALYELAPIRFPLPNPTWEEHGITGRLRKKS